MPESTDRLDAFDAYRERMNHRILEGTSHIGIKRFFNLDTAAYRNGALDGKTKELLGLVASMVLRCNDCIDYHLGQCVEAGYSDEELDDQAVALVATGDCLPELHEAQEAPIDLEVSRYPACVFCGNAA